MRIGLDGFPLASPKTGVGHYIFELARALSRFAPEHQFELISPVNFAAGVEAEINSVPNLRAVSRQLNSIPRGWWGIGLPRYIRQTALDLFHGTNFDVPLWNRDRTVVTVHDLSVFLHADTHETNIARRARRRLRIMMRSAALIVTPTHAVKAEICERFKIDPNRIAVTPEAPRASFSPLAPANCQTTLRKLGIEENFLLFVGTIEPRKNLVTLLRAFDQLLRQTSHRPQLVIAGGKGWLTSEFHQLIESSNFGDRICLRDYLGDDDLRALYSSCKTFIYPSVYEGFGLPPLEAMACGAPVIASRISSLVEVLGDNARLVDPLDAPGLARTLADLLDSEAERARLSALSIKHAAEFSWAETARLTFEVYEQVLRRTKMSDKL